MICARKTKGNIYYVHQESHRVKNEGGTQGKGKSSGKSRVVTGATYLGTAERIVTAIKQARDPVSVRARDFGLVAASYQIALEIGLPDALAKHLGGKRSGISIWMYFVLSIINRIDGATSEEKMGQWLAGAILLGLLSVDPRKFHGKNF